MAKMDHQCRACSAGLKPAGWLVFPLTESLFTSCQNSIFLSQQSAGTVFFSSAEQARGFCWMTVLVQFNYRVVQWYRVVVRQWVWVDVSIQPVVVYSCYLLLDFFFVTCPFGVLVALLYSFAWVSLFNVIYNLPDSIWRPSYSMLTTK